MNNFIMEDNNEEQIEEVSPQELIVHPPHHEIDLNIQICKKIIAKIPANELRATHRPDNMVPRTFFLDRPFYLLPNALNQSSNETLAEVTSKKMPSAPSDGFNETIQEYLARNKCINVYNKLNTYKTDSCYFTGKLKGLDSLTDYNWRSFKQLQTAPEKPQRMERETIDSDFESGNICRAYMNSCSSQEPPEYFLLIENDLNTYGYNIWFFFRFRKREAGTIKFSIINIIKETSFFSQGMKISIFSMNQSREGKRWFKGGDNITFAKTNFTRNHHDLQYYYSLSFQYTFESLNDEVYFALNQPYTYSRLVTLINNPPRAHRDRRMEVKTICYSIANNIVPLLHFYKQNRVSHLKGAILIMARQHPCQTSGSFIAQAIIRELAINDEICDHLLNQFQFYVIPMVNPDGVIHGMSRTNMAGLDLNRQWSQHSLRELTPETTKIQQFISLLSRSRRIKYMIDLHGHGKKLNSFFFCCKATEAVKDNYRLFSFAMHKLEDRFNLPSCTYGISRDKENTLRSKISGMGIRHSYTLETSQFGWKNQNNEVVHFNEQDYNRIGCNLLKTIFLIEADPALTDQYLGLSKEAILAELAAMQEQLSREEKLNEGADALSDSDPEGDRLDVKDLLSKCQNKLITKKIQQNYSTGVRFKTKQKNGVEGKKEQESKMSSSQNSMQKRQTKSNLFRGRPQLYQQTKHGDFKDKWLEKKKTLLNREKTNKKIILPLKINKTIESDHIEYAVLKQQKMKKPSRLNTEPTSRERWHISSSLSASQHNVNRWPCTHPKKKQRHQLQVMKQGISEPVSGANVHLKFKELKKQSLNYILTETISIMKIGRKKEESSTETPLKVSNHEEQLGNIKRQCNTTFQRETIQERSEDSVDSYKAKHQTNYKNFIVREGKNFISRNNKVNSVYYHYPLL